MSKPVLYVFGGSVWASVPQLAAAELYSEGDIDIKSVNLVEGANFDPAFIKLNPKATLPTLESDEGIHTTTKDVTAYLLSKSSQTRNTTSKPDFIKQLHDPKWDPNFALLLARNDEELKVKGELVVHAFLSGRQAALEKYAASPEGQEFQSFYDAKKTDNGGLLAVYQGKVPDEVKKGFFAKSQAHFEALKVAVYEEIPTHLPDSGFIDGAEPGETDFHLAAWLARISATVGGKSGDDGLQAIEKGYGKPVPDKLAAYWKAWASRDSWKKVYADRLH